LVGYWCLGKELLLSTSTILPITSCANQLNCKQIACLQVIDDVQVSSLFYLHYFIGNFVD
jgi:hypothetical protein